MTKRIDGKYTSIDVKASIVDEATISQLQSIADDKNYEGAKIVVMPDTHAGKDCVVGFTMQYDKDNPIINPNIVGVDICCGMLVQPIDNVKIDFQRFDDVVHSLVNIEKEYTFENKFRIGLETDKMNYNYYNKQIGTLGYGNHFVEIDYNFEQKFIVIHTGSRHLGWRVCNNYVKKCVDGVLRGQDVLDYLYDMKLVQQYAELNRKVLMDLILENYELEYNIDERFQTLHNYIDLENNIIRKGAISAQKGELVLIPLNMKDGSILGVGKGNPEWNYSAPHGAGRILSRKQAREQINIKDYEDSMFGVYTTCINKDTIDESVFAYKPTQTILEDIFDTISVKDILVPIYNFKNS